MNCSPRIYVRTLFVIIFTLLFTHITHAGQPTAAIKLGWDMASFSELRKPGMYTGALVAGELYGPSRERLPGQPVLGAGVECMALLDSRELHDIYTFIPLYGTLKVTLHEQESLPTSLVFKLGYNWLTGDDHRYVRTSEGSFDHTEYVGGVYYSIGIDQQLSEHFVGGIHCAEHRGTIKPIWDYGPSPSERHIRYWRISIVFGYLFT